MYDRIQFMGPVGDWNVALMVMTFHGTAENGTVRRVTYRDRLVNWTVYGDSLSFEYNIDLVCTFKTNRDGNLMTLVLEEPYTACGSSNYKLQCRLTGRVALPSAKAEKSAPRGR